MRADSGNRDRRHEVVSHPERGRRAILDKQVEQAENSLSKVALTLQFQRSSVNVPLEENLEQEDSIPLLHHLLGVFLLEALRDSDECFRERLLAYVVQEPNVRIQHCGRSWQALEQLVDTP